MTTERVHRVLENLPRDEDIRFKIKMNNYALWKARELWNMEGLNTSLLYLFAEILTGIQSSTHAFLSSRLTEYNSEVGKWFEL